ncbi:hypothetical protein G6F35_009484 [Rhizopus arrhizus]|nr:hypothetical protein G6F35_009484 [Rhizopus arrhizus]
MIDLSKLNSRLSTDYKTPTTWNFHIERCAHYRTRFVIESVMALEKELQKRKSNLLILFGKPERLLKELSEFLKKNDCEIHQIHTHKEYAYEELVVEKELTKIWNKDIAFHHDTTMIHPDDVDFTFEQTPKVYAHFRRRIEKMNQPVRPLLQIPDELPAFPDIIWKFSHAEQGKDLLEELYEAFAFEKDKRSAFPWPGGEDAARERLENYLFKTDGAIHYKQTRNGMIGTEYSTKFSAYLSHGCLSPRLIWHELNRLQSQKKIDKTGGDEDGIYWIRFELLWRDFFRFLVAGSGNRVFHLHGFRDMSNKEAQEDLKKKNSYSNKVWKSNDDQFNKWKVGQTGMPYIDASMRELVNTGFLNNRGRQNVASYIAKDLELDWRIGAEWFESLLKDHDVYSNYGNWQYGNRDYDPDGDYIRLWCPELKNLPVEYVHCPWRMSKEEQEKYKCVIGKDYPEPILVVENWKRYYPSAPNGKRISDYFVADKNKKTKHE